MNDPTTQKTLFQFIIQLVEKKGITFTVANISADSRSQATAKVMELLEGKSYRFDLVHQIDKATFAKILGIRVETPKEEAQSVELPKPIKKTRKQQQANFLAGLRLSVDRFIKDKEDRRVVKRIIKKYEK